MNSNPLPPAVSTTSPDFAAVASLLAAMADPATYTARLAEIAEATAKHDRLLADAKAELQKLEAETAAAAKRTETERAAAFEEIDRRRTQIGVDAAALTQRSENLDQRAKEIEATAATLAAREAAIIRRETALRDAADAVASARG